jgi:hypothetical protein
MSDVTTTSQAPGIEPHEHSAALAHSEHRARQTRDGISFRRLAWVAPLTVIAALLVNVCIRALVQTDPSLGRMPQLGPPLITLTVVGAVVAVALFLLFALFVPRPIFWYRVLGVVALLVSWIPDVMLALGGQSAGTAMRVVGPIAVARHQVDHLLPAVQRPVVQVVQAAPALVSPCRVRHWSRCWC